MYYSALQNKSVLDVFYVMQSELTKEREVSHEKEAGEGETDKEKSDRLFEGKHSKSGSGKEQSGYPDLCERSQARQRGICRGSRLRESVVEATKDQRGHRLTEKGGLAHCR